MPDSTSGQSASLCRGSYRKLIPSKYNIFDPSATPSPSWSNSTRTVPPAKFPETVPATIGLQVILSDELSPLSYKRPNKLSAGESVIDKGVPVK